MQKEEPAPQQNSKNLLEKVKNFYFAQKAQKKSGDSTQNLVEDYPQFNKGIIQKLPNNETVISYPVYNKISYVYSDRIGYVKRYVVKLDARDSIVETKTFQMIGNKEFLGQNKDNIPAKYYQGTMPTQNFFVILSNTNNTQDTTHIKYPNLIFLTNTINRVGPGPCINKPEGYVIDFKTCLITYYYRDCTDGQIKSTTMQSENACNFDGGSILYPPTSLPSPPFGAGMGDNGLPIFYENPNCQNNTKPEINPYETSCQDVPLNGCNGSLNDNTYTTGDCNGEKQRNFEFNDAFKTDSKMQCIYDKVKNAKEQDNSALFWRLTTFFSGKGEYASHKLRFELVPDLVSDEGGDVFGEYEYDQSDKKHIIRINKRLLDEHPAIVFAAVLLHEMMHAYFKSEIIKLGQESDLEFVHDGDTQILKDLKWAYYSNNFPIIHRDHNLMARPSYRLMMETALKSFDNNSQEDTYYQAIAWAGLMHREVKEWKDLSPDKKDTIRYNFEKSKIIFTDTCE